MYYTSEYDQSTYNYSDIYKLLENTGTAANPVFEEKLDTGIEYLDDFYASSFVDIDADGDMDLFMIGSGKTDGEWHMGTKYYENTGYDPFKFTERSGFGANPLVGINDVYFQDVECLFWILPILTMMGIMMWCLPATMEKFTLLRI